MTEQLSAVQAHTLSVRHVSKNYGEIEACKDLSFDAPGGAITLLVGPNGAGKSTLIKSIMGFLRFRGEIRLGPWDVRSAEAKAALGYIPEMPALYEMLTVDEHLEFIARVYQVRNWQPYAEALVERMALGEHRQKLGGELSKGMQQKVSICCALLPRPQFLLFDEPLVGLDPHAIKEVKALFLELRASGCGLLISTHMLDSVEESWDQALILMRGQIAALRDRDSADRDGKSLEDVFFSVTEGQTQA